MKGNHSISFLRQVPDEMVIKPSASLPGSYVAHKISVGEIVSQRLPCRKSGGNQGRRSSIDGDSPPFNEKHVVLKARVSFKQRKVLVRNGSYDGEHWRLISS
jgi:hypothetical protein